MSLNDAHSETPRDDTKEKNWVHTTVLRTAHYSGYRWEQRFLVAKVHSSVWEL